MFMGINLMVEPIRGEPGRFYAHTQRNTYLVDLLEHFGVGACGCEDFEFRRRPEMGEIRKRPVDADRFRCKHIKAARVAFGLWLVDRVTDELARTWNMNTKDKK